MLDTNIVSYYVKNTHPSLRYRMRSLPWESLAISSITETEVLAGLAALPVEHKMQRNTAPFLADITVLPWNSECAKEYGRLVRRQREIGRPLTLLDGMIAAHALHASLTLVSADGAFQSVLGLTVEDWTVGPEPA